MTPPGVESFGATANPPPSRKPQVVQTIYGPNPLTFVSAYAVRHEALFGHPENVGR